MRIVSIVILGMILLLLLAGCVPAANPFVGTPDSTGVIGGFWQGLWHGIIAPVTFIISLFNSNVTMYDVHNNGGWYNFGFLLGVGVWAGGGGAASRRR